MKRCLYVDVVNSDRSFQEYFQYFFKVFSGSSSAWVELYQTIKMTESQHDTILMKMIWCKAGIRVLRWAQLSL